jgi:hypothetical protein
MRRVSLALDPGRELDPDPELESLMAQFYEAISFSEGASPDWALMRSLFSPHARITRITPEGSDYLDVTGFRNFAEEMLEVGAFTSFFEREVARRVDRYGKVIHVASAYETKVSADAVDYLERGINSLQLIVEGEAWKILSLCWDDHAPFKTNDLVPVIAGRSSNG